MALLPRLQRRADALDKARTAVTDLLDSYRGARRRQDAGQLVEVITRAQALRQHLWQMRDSASHEMLWFCDIRAGVPFCVGTARSIPASWMISQTVEAATVTPS
ncbi:hypothetical protein [Streptomyces sp. NPDC047079]|uniref:hypothetical protein n=1 Tax=Streptomyces sp. NPDC047079 TaxID=3154607 RepID=UPI0033E6D19A